MPSGRRRLVRARPSLFLVRLRRHQRALIYRYVHGPGSDEILAWWDSGLLLSIPSGGGGTIGWAYPVTDHLGSTVLTQSEGATGATGILDRFSYSAYGEVSDPTGYPFKFTGRKFDAETNLYYYRARYYSPTLGRFLQTDPIGYGDGLNWYAYVGNDPVNGTDPSGLCTASRINTESGSICQGSGSTELFVTIAKKRFRIKVKGLPQSKANDALAAGARADASQRKAIYKIGKAVLDQTASDEVKDREFDFSPLFGGGKVASDGVGNHVVGGTSLFPTLAAVRDAGLESINGQNSGPRQAIRIFGAATLPRQNLTGPVGARGKPVKFSGVQNLMFVILHEVRHDFTKSEISANIHALSVLKKIRAY